MQNKEEIHELRISYSGSRGISYLDSPEHRIIGKGGPKIIISPHLTVTFGDITALAGDYVGSVDQIRNLAGVGQDNEPETVKELKYIIEVLVKGGEDHQYSKEVQRNVNKRFYHLAANNSCHFTHAYEQEKGQPHQEKANLFDSNNRPLNNATMYRQNHRTAISLAYQARYSKKTKDEAMLYEAFASHFLTDAYAAGHVRVTRLEITEHWNNRIPMFWTNIQWWIAENIAQYIKDNSSVFDSKGAKLLTPPIYMGKNKEGVRRNTN